MPDDRARESEEYRGFAIAPYGDEWEATYENSIRRVFPTKRKARRWIDRRAGRSPNRRGIVRRAIDALIGTNRPTIGVAFRTAKGSA